MNPLRADEEMSATSFSRQILGAKVIHEGRAGGQLPYAH